MKAGDYIFAKHPEFGNMFPAKVDRVARKYLWYTDDEGNLVKIAKTSCRLQDDWAKENVN